MARYKVEQKVLCEVKVWYEIECSTMENALDMVALNTSPTDRTMDGTDYEIQSDNKIIKTMIVEV